MAEGQYIRQLATIICIDAVGFSRLMGVDEEAALTAFEERRDLIAQRCAAHGGRMFGAAGDSIMAEFGSPIEAVRAATDFQAAIRMLNEAKASAFTMVFRVGIHTGNVIVRGDYLYGDDVNIAARVQEWAQQGSFALSETVWHHIKDLTETPFTDLGSFKLKNIAYPVRILLAGEPRHPHGVRVERSAPSAPPTGGPPAIAVLPLRCEPDQEFMADGIAEDIIYGLSMTRWLAVIARNSSFQFRDDTPGSRFIGNALGAHYLVTGSFHRDNGTVAIAVSLEEASSGRIVWTRRFERPLENLVALQTEIGHEIVSHLEKEVDRVEQARTFQVPWESLATWQLVRRGRWHMGRRTRNDTHLALGFFEEAHSTDAGSSATLNELAWWYFWRSWLRYGERQDLERVGDYARRAMLVDSMDARPHAHLGICEIMRGNARAAIDHLDEAVRINPSFAFAFSALGSANILLGRARAAVPFFLKAERFSPLDLYGFHNLGELTAAYCMLGEWDAAIDTAQRSLNFSPAYFYSHFLRIGALARTGRTEEAAAERQAFNARHPSFDFQQISWIPFADKSVNEAFIANFRLTDAAATSPDNVNFLTDRPSLQIRDA